VTHPTMTATVADAMKDHTPPRPDEPSPGLGEMAGMDLGMRVLSYLIAGVLVYGGLGWLGDHLLGTGFLLPIGIVLGAAGGCYVIVKRYGQVATAAALPVRRTAGGRAIRRGRPHSQHTTKGAR